MTEVLLVLAVWVFVALLFGLLLGRVSRLGSSRTEDLDEQQ